MKHHQFVETGLRKYRLGGFTLIELLVVITIITILATIGFPIQQAIIESSRQVKAREHARQIVLGMRAYAVDSGGVFPGGKNQYGQEITNSNDAFRDLVPDYIEDERIFAVGGSQWGSKVDNKMESPGEILEAGENHFAYISGLSDSSRNWWPLVVDGTAGGGVYTRDQGQRGGRWKGKRAVVVFVDGSAAAAKLRGEGDHRFVPRLDDDNMNALDVESYMPDGVQLLDPAG
jgi:prepilin-type N-terminal cleavage/methylation domain-containing protein